MRHGSRRHQSLCSKGLVIFLHHLAEQQAPDQKAAFRDDRQRRRPAHDSQSMFVSQLRTCFDGVLSSICKGLDQLVDFLLGERPRYRVCSHAAISTEALKWRRDWNIRARQRLSTVWLIVCRAYACQAPWRRACLQLCEQSSGVPLQVLANALASCLEAACCSHLGGTPGQHARAVQRICRPPHARHSQLVSKHRPDLCGRCRVCLGTCWVQNS